MHSPLTSKLLIGLAALLLILQAACATGSTGPAVVPGGATALSTQSASSPAVPITGGQTTAASSDAQAMLQAVVQHYQTVGRDQALKDFTNQVPPFNNSNLFVLCIGADHNISALGGFPLLVGVSADQLSQSGGGAFGELLWDVSGTIPRGSIPFQWKDPATDQQESKTFYYQRLSRDICGVVANQP